MSSASTPKTNLDDLYLALRKSIDHLDVLDNTLKQSKTHTGNLHNYQRDRFGEEIRSLGLRNQIYGQDDRQMILADLIEYIFFGRGYYAAFKSLERREILIRAVLRFVNMLMAYETMTSDSKARHDYMDSLAKRLPEVGGEAFFGELRKFDGIVGIANNENAIKQLDDYFDTLLPKTAGGLWHELLVYAFVLRNNFGYIVPLVLSQRLLTRKDHLVPPDFLLITGDKRIYGN